VTRTIFAHLLADHCEADSLAGKTAVVIDVLRASTTIVHALAAGAQDILPCLTIPEAQELAAQLGPAALLCGERGGIRIDGFDLGNSPAEYTPERVGGRRLVLTTTNGTRALQHASAADSVWIAAFVNLSSIAARLRVAEHVVLLCSGTRGEITREDTLLAGAVVASQSSGGESIACNDEALLARDAWLHVAEGLAGRADRLADELRDSRGGRNVTRIGQGADIELAARIDAFRLLPGYDPGTRRITASA
jgi:2-phosphosulfolactate phosphatase